MAKALNQDDLEPSSKAGTFTPPSYTMKKIYDAIPTHCFQRSSLRSLRYVLQDFSMVFTLMALATQIPRIQNPYINSLTWLLYSVCQGLIFTGLWELAHESGHGALSKRKWVNNSMGLLIHSFLLVPFHSWRITHATHHKTTNNLERDIAFVPDLKEVWESKRKERADSAWHNVYEVVQDTPVAALIFLFFHQIIAFPIYLILNNFALPRIAASPWYKRSHFYFGGDGPNFKPFQSRDIIISDMGILCTALTLYTCASRFGIWNVMCLYGFPYLWTNHWILVITYLQHTDVSLPYYPSKSWTFLGGCASTIDRDFGFIGRVLFHGAIENHVLHHHICRIPFYHAAEATKCLRKVMGTHYRKDGETPYLWAFWRNFRTCRFVEAVDGGKSVYFFVKEQ